MLRVIYRRFFSRLAEAWFDRQRMRWYAKGPRERVRLGEGVELSDAMLNTVSGSITVGDHSFCGQRVSIVTGNHDIGLTGKPRAEAYPVTGRDIVIGRGVFLGTACTVLGPCIIGDNAVVAAGALVRSDVPANAIVAGVPARQIGDIRDREPWFGKATG